MYLVYSNNQRFLKERISGTGRDPKGAFHEFVQRDLIRPLEKPSIYDKKLQMSTTYTQKWSLQTGKNCPNEPEVPKIQQFREYNFPKRTENDIIRYQNNFLSTDNISLKNEIPNKYLSVKESINNIGNIKGINTSYGNFGINNNNSSNRNSNKNIVNIKNENDYTRTYSQNKFPDIHSSNTNALNGNKSYRNIANDKENHVAFNKTIGPSAAINNRKCKFFLYIII